MIIDSHCHLGSHKFSRDEIPELIARAHKNGVTRLITLATGEASTPRRKAGPRKATTLGSAISSAATSILLRAPG